MHEAIELGRIQPGHMVCLVAFGAGLTWGSAFLHRVLRTRYKQDIEHGTWELRFPAGAHGIQRATVINSRCCAPSCCAWIATRSATGR
jgi:hypothetical protein